MSDIDAKLEVGDPVVLIAKPPNIFPLPPVGSKGEVAYKAVGGWVISFGDGQIMAVGNLDWSLYIRVDKRVEKLKQQIPSSLKSWYKSIQPALGHR